MTVEMKKYKIGDILELQRGYDLTSAEMDNGKIPVAGSNGIIGYHNVAKCTTPCITVGRSGSAGKVHFYKEPVWAHNTALYVSNFKGNDPKYLFYLLSVLKLETLCGSSVVPSLNRNVVYPMEIPFCSDVGQQRNISSILSSFDDRIENLRAQNQVLEQTAKVIYDYTFLQCAGHQTTYNKILNRNIPENWEVKKLSEIAKTYSGGTPKSTELKYYENGSIPWINSGELNKPLIIKAEHFITKEGLSNSSAKFYPENTVLIAMYGATVGKTSLLAFPATSNQAICGVISNDEIFCYYMYFLISSLGAHYIMLSTGSARDNISQDVIKNTMVPVPDTVTIKK